MIATYPRVVVWDESKQHHIALIHDRSAGVVHYFCSECSYEMSFDACVLPSLKELIEEGGRSQVVVWVEHDGK